MGRRSVSKWIERELGWASSVTLEVFSSTGATWSNSKIKTHYSQQVANIALGLFGEESVEKSTSGYNELVSWSFLFGGLGPVPRGMSGWETSYLPWREPQS